MTGATSGSALVRIAYPDAGPLHLTIAARACSLRITTGGVNAWVEGSYRAAHGAGERGAPRLALQINLALGGLALKAN